MNKFYFSCLLSIGFFLTSCTGSRIGDYNEWLTKTIVDIKNKIKNNSHNFGLSHNFKASVDEKNYWTSVDEIRRFFPNANLEEYLNKGMPKSSSVMDYLPPLEVLPLIVLGKYDLAALTFIYANQFEYLESNTVRNSKRISKELDFPEDPSQQKPIRQHFDQEIFEAYLHCPDHLAKKPQGENFYCRRHDYGSNPLETVNHYIEKFNHSFHSVRYRYDTDKAGAYSSLFSDIFAVVAKFYERWSKLRDQYFKSVQQQYLIIDYRIGDESSIEDYKRTVTEGLDINKDYNAHYQIRESFYEFVTNIAFLETMKCPKNQCP